MEFELTITKRGLPAIWERGGGATNTGSATVVAGPNGERLKPVYIRGRGHLSCGEHALFIVKEGYHVIMASHWRRDFTVKVYRIASIDLDSKVASLELINEFSQGEWDSDLPIHLKDAVDTAMEKSICYHCREPHFYRA